MIRDNHGPVDVSIGLLAWSWLVLRYKYETTQHVPHREEDAPPYINSTSKSSKLI